MFPHVRWLTRRAFLSPLRGLCGGCGSAPHGLRRGLHSFAPSELAHRKAVAARLGTGGTISIPDLNLDCANCDIGHGAFIHFIQTIGGRRISAQRTKVDRFAVRAGSRHAREFAARAGSRHAWARRGRRHRQQRSREAAEECSPRRKPWVAATKKLPSPGGAKESCPTHPATSCFT